MQETPKLRKWSAYKITGKPFVRILWDKYTIQVNQSPWGDIEANMGEDYTNELGHIGYRGLFDCQGDDELDCLSQCIAKIRELENAKK